MWNNARLVRLCLLALAFILTACAPLTPPVSEPPAEISRNAAVLELVQRAEEETASGRLEQAAGWLERALRVEPQNPWLWYLLAENRYRDGRYDEAEGLAEKSLSLTGDEPTLASQNRALITQVRAARGSVGP